MAGRIKIDKKRIIKLYVEDGLTAKKIAEKLGCGPILILKKLKECGIKIKKSSDYRRIKIEKIEEKIKQIHGDVIILDRDTYKNLYTKCRFIDKDYGEFFAYPSNILAGSKNKRRSIDNRIISIEEIEKRIEQIHGSNVHIDKSTYVDTKKKCRFIDKDYGEWWATPNDVMLKRSGHRKRGLEECKQTVLKEYGVEHVSQNKEIREKIRQTCLKNHGVEHPLQNEEIKTKMEDTCLERYGTKYPMQNLEIALKSVRASNNTYILKHWKTGEEVVCKAGYEKATVEYFNKNKIDFKWQSKTFGVIMLDGKKRTYRPDCYVYKYRKWIEIKGYFREEAKEKYNYFHINIKPNSELWDQKKLKELGIL